MFPSYLMKWKKTMVPSYYEPDNTLSQLFGERKKWNPANLDTKKCSSQLLGARKKIMTDLFKVRKTGSHAIRSKIKMFHQLLTPDPSGKNCFLAISSLTNTVAAIWREEKVILIPAIWRLYQKIYFTTVRSKEKVAPEIMTVYLKSEKLVHSN